MLSQNQIAVTKVVVAAVLLAALAGVAGAHLVPNVSVFAVLLYSAAGFGVLCAALVVVAVVGLTFRQFILRKGGTDPQWFWLPGEPRGLRQLREQAAAQESER